MLKEVNKQLKGDGEYEVRKVDPETGENVSRGFLDLDAENRVVYVADESPAAAELLAEE
jgi:hypothetical protein